MTNEKEASTGTSTKKTFRTISVDSETYDLIQALARTQERSISSVIRRALTFAADAQIGEGE